MGARGILTSLAMLFLVAAVPTAAAPHRQADFSFRAGDLLRLINAERAKRDVPGLRVSRALVRAAQFHSKDMARHGFFSHRSKDGSSFAERIRRFYAPPGGGRWRAGENILWGSASLRVSEALRMWMRSPVHRANLLARSWTEVGIAVMRASRAPGVFRGDSVTIVTADFGIRPV